MTILECTAQCAQGKKISVGGKSRIIIIDPPRGFEVGLVIRQN